MGDLGWPLVLRSSESDWSESVFADSRMACLVSMDRRGPAACLVSLGPIIWFPLASRPVLGLSA